MKNSPVKIKTESEFIANIETLTQAEKTQLAVIVLLDSLDTIDRYEVLKRYR
jgi:hypothetical protein